MGVGFRVRCSRVPAGAYFFLNEPEASAAWLWPKISQKVPRENMHRIRFVVQGDSPFQGILLRMMLNLPLMEESKMRRCASFLALAFLFPLVMVAEEVIPQKEVWKTLFDGKTLDGWKSSPFVGEGKVFVKGGVIVMEKGEKLTGVTFTKGDFPKRDYEVEIVARKVEGNDFFATTTFPVGDQFVSMVVGGWGGTLVGISSVNGADASENGFSKNKEFEAKKWYTIKVRVGQKRVQTQIDQEQFNDIDTSDARLTVRFEVQPSRPFGISTYDTIGEIKSVRVRSLNDKEKKILATPDKMD